MTRKRPLGADPAPGTTRMPPVPGGHRTSCDGGGGEKLATHNRRNPTWPGQIWCRATITGARRAQRPTKPSRWPPPSGDGSMSARVPQTPSSFTSQVVPEADSSDDRTREHGRRVATARVSVPLSRPARATWGCPYKPHCHRKLSRSHKQVTGDHRETPCL
jgi:hypothetical protein